MLIRLGYEIVFESPVPRADDIDALYPSFTGRYAETA